MVSGVVIVINGDKTFLVTANGSAYIPIWQVHALTNPGIAVGDDRSTKPDIFG